MFERSRMIARAPLPTSYLLLTGRVKCGLCTHSYYNVNILGQQQMLSNSKHLKRSSSTFANSGVNNSHQSHSLPPLPPWPKSNSPSPYEIFGILPSQFNKAQVRILFYQMAKVYHPDSSGGGSIIDDGLRAERFKKLVEAYDILKSDSKRSIYDSKARARSRGNYHHHPYSKNSSTYTSNRSAPFMSDNFYTRGFYEGYEEEASNRMNDEQFQEKLKDSRKQIAIYLGIAVGLIAALQITAVFRVAEKTREKVQHATWLAEMEDLKARSNYSMGLTNDDRVSRFLAVRSSSGYYDNYQKNDLGLPAPEVKRDE